MMKLFGKTFSTSEGQKGLANDTNEQQCSFDHGTNLKDNTGSYELNGKKSLAREGQIKNGNGISIEIETSTSQSQENEGQGETTNSSRQQILRKPDRIIPCPRCKSMDTKFCYYNNYNVNQPRHFCRKCQRYWTAGGIMRDVPVGSGRRSYHKQSRALHHPQNVVSNSLESIRSNDVYNFGSNISHCESTNPLGFVSDHFANPDQVGSNGGSNELLGSNCHGFPLQAPFYTVPHWQTAWPCNIPVSWPTPNSPSQSLLSSSSASSQTLGKHPRNEAHIINALCDLKGNKDVSREALGGVWIPKSLRFDDPNEASKSSIWEALGINGEKTSLINKRSLFKDLIKSVEERNHSERTSPTLQANPAAMSRSQNFRETM